jgi:hypothetical protein
MTMMQQSIHGRHTKGDNHYCDRRLMLLQSFIATSLEAKMSYVHDPLHIPEMRLFLKFEGAEGLTVGHEWKVKTIR